MIKVINKQLIKNNKSSKSSKSIITATLAMMISIVLLVIARFFEDYFVSIMTISGFLSWHNLLEITGIIAYIALFIVSFYTYKQERNVKAIVVGSLLMAAGIIDVFHTLSYKGMPDFFLANLTANRATTFWIAARLVAVAAYVVSGLMRNEKKSTINENWFTSAAITISISVFIIVTYFPGLLPAMYIEGVGLSYEKKLLEYFIIAITAIVAIIYMYRYTKSKNEVLFVMFSAMMLSIMSEFAFTIYVDVYGIYNFLGHILKCISLFMVFRVNFSKYITAPYTALTVAQGELKDYADNLDKLVEIRTSELRMTNERLMEDVEYARDIQKSMLPSFFPNSAHISFNALYMPAHSLSGDFYDVFWLDESHIGFYLCDVSGHGVPAAMLTVFLKQCVDSFVEADRSKGTLSSPAEMLSQIYNAFNNTNFRDEVYIVLIYFVYDTKENRLVFSSAGMNEVPAYLDAQGRLRDIDIKGFPICKLRKVYDASYEDTELLPKPGDKLFVYTDGLVELRNGKKEQYTSERLKNLFSELGNGYSDHVIASIKEDIKSFAGSSTMTDDITLLCVEFR